MKNVAQKKKEGAGKVGFFPKISSLNKCTKSLSMKIFVLKKRFMDSHFAHYFGDMTSSMTSIKINSEKKILEILLQKVVQPIVMKESHIKMYCCLREGPAFKNNTLENYAAEKTKKNIPSHFLQSTQYYTCIK